MARSAWNLENRHSPLTKTQPPATERCSTAARNSDQGERGFTLVNQLSSRANYACSEEFCNPVMTVHDTGVFESLRAVSCTETALRRRIWVVLTARCQISQSCTGARMKSRPGLHGLWQHGCFSLRKQTVECLMLSAVTQKEGSSSTRTSVDIMCALLLPGVLVFTW